VQSLLGHTTPSTTLLYTHAQDEAKKAALKQAAKVLFPNVPKTKPKRAGTSEKQFLIQ